MFGWANKRTIRTFTFFIKTSRGAAVSATAQRVKQSERKVVAEMIVKRLGLPLAIKRVKRRRSRAMKPFLTYLFDLYL